MLSIKARRMGAACVCAVVVKEAAHSASAANFKARRRQIKEGVIVLKRVRLRLDEVSSGTQD
ncbi:hypothetical protein [Variovorax sp. Root411]|uniref:hypothetical protein n=1 Tax=Variovorax sp. Root411 TaxID=1736530 RepID=UPI001F41FD84|nr:hypothetical protein [Variovorax sp. Root411]